MKMSQLHRIKTQGQTRGTIKTRLTWDRSQLDNTDLLTYENDQRSTELRLQINPEPPKPEAAAADQP